jgi:hypothetical protein
MDGDDGDEDMPREAVYPDPDSTPQYPWLGRDGNSSTNQIDDGLSVQGRYITPYGQPSDHAGFELPESCEDPHLDVVDSDLEYDEGTATYD